MTGTDEASGRGGLAGCTVAVTAERRAEEQAELFRKRGADVIIAPTVHTVDLSGDNGLRATTELVLADSPDWVVATTGSGMRPCFLAASGSSGRGVGTGCFRLYYSRCSP